MRTVKLVASLAVALLMPACGGHASQESPQLATSVSALTSAASRGCTFTVSYKEVMPPIPPTYVPVITRQASASCPWGAGSAELPGAYSPPQVSIAANDLGVAVSYTYKYSPSGSAGTWLQIVHLDPQTLSVVRSESLQSHYNTRPSYVSGELSILLDGTTLKVKGTKGANFPGEETWGGAYFVATYPNFFTSTTPPNIVVSETPEPSGVGTWSVNGNLTTARSDHSATLLKTTGDVLVVSNATAEVYNPYSNMSQPTAAPIYARIKHVATPLPSGKVLVTGGWTGSAPLYWQYTSEVYDQATGAWTFAGSMNTPRGNHTATLLDSGKVLVVGGNSTNGLTSTAELWDPDTNAWSNTASVSVPRSGHVATLLYSGKVLVTGGTNASSVTLQDAQVFDPSTNAWSPVAAMPRARSGHLAVRLYSGAVLVLGGGSDAVDLYDPYNDVWTSGATLSSGGSAVSATMLYSGEVLVTLSNGQAFVYDPSANVWTFANTLSAPLNGHTATMLHTGQVLVTGGYTSGTSVTTVQRYTR
ncbi:kelch repeat-containing protein [Vitiosangium sp. GDMCC 1.1324]|uniref:Kelch repeat-containing protein n=1 Tax=Vitiosangium sp. (strain GDMCC 1.1324) TaxID=2138576 RepID=UPI001E344F3A|nr:kelch repeat-containing protein [Vitiosangium sp. GDMCC 1.1324]